MHRALLQSLSSQQPTPTSPSSSSTLSFADNTKNNSQSAPSPSQILTALLLFTLLSNPPSYSLPLAKAKEALVAKNIGASIPSGPLAILSAGGQALESRALYGCIAKRLLKIDRSTKEQVLKFDV